MAGSRTSSDGAVASLSAPSARSWGSPRSAAQRTAWRRPDGIRPACAWATVRQPAGVALTIVLLLALPLLGGGWLWLRGSSLVAVEHVHISGVHGPEAIEIRAALDDSATRMTTMDFNAGALRSALASYAIVAAVQVKTSFPHTVSISVSERPPVAALVSAGTAHRRRGRRDRARAGALLQLAADRERLGRAGTRSTPRRTRGAGSGHGARRGAGAACSIRGARLRGPRRAHGGDAQRAARLLRQRHAPARQVAVARARARLAQLGRRPVHRRASARTPGGRVLHELGLGRGLIDKWHASADRHIRTHRGRARGEPRQRRRRQQHSSSGSTTAESESATKESESTSSAAGAATSSGEAGSSSSADATSGAAPGSSEASASPGTEASVGTSESG